VKRGRWPTLVGVGLPALVAYVPLLLTERGQVGADTKTYLYLDPGRVLERAPYLWDEHIGAGTITHQNIGYLWPMGPWYWLFDTLGLPDWVAQRLWLGTVMFAAALGVRFLLRTLGWRDRTGEYGVLVASLAYMLSPYVLDYAARISVILLPWAGLPWLIALTVRTLRWGRWREPALFALVVLTVGGINATALIMVAPAVLLWILYAVFVEHEVSGRDAWAGLGRMGVLTLATSLWWIAGLWAQGSYGLPVLRFTEAYRAVAESSSAPEVLRGLGYWFFYGRDKLGPWIEPSVEYTNRTAVLALSYLLPTLALASAALVRWRHRAYFLAVLGTGVLLSVAAHPWDDSSPAGALFKEFTRTDAGLALRSTPRAVPLVALAVAVFLGAGVRALGARVSTTATWRGPALAAAAIVLVVGNLSPLWTGTMIADNLKRPEDIPAYWEEAAAWLDEQDQVAGGWSTRAIEIPGSDFASYRWGNTVDPVTPGLMDRPYLARELFQYGTPASAELLIAYDRALHENTLDTDAIVPVARLLGAGDLVHRADLQYERFRTARPVVLADQLAHVPGLGAPVSFGPAEPNVAGPEQPLLDEIALALDPALADPAPVVVHPLDDPLGILRARSADRPLLLDGGPAGVVDAAGMGLLQDDQLVLYAASYADDAAGLEQALGDGADLLVTDTNRVTARRWGTIQQNSGYTERADEEPPTDDPSDQRLEVFPGAPDSTRTTSEQRGPVLVTADRYGNPVTFTPDDRPANAVDGSLATSWRVGALDDVRGDALRLDYAEPMTADRITLVQPVTGIINRYVTGLDLVFDGEERVPVELDRQSHDLPGQTVTFDERTFTTLELVITATDVGPQRRYDSFSGVGFAEVSVGSDELTGGPVQTELIHPPTFLLDAAGDDSIAHRLGYLFTRLRANPQEVVRSDEEPWLARVVDVPTERRFGLAADARLAAGVPDEQIDALLGIPDADGGGITASTGSRLPGAIQHRASAAVDGDPATFWMPAYEAGDARWLELTLPEEVTIDALDVTMLSDGRHSVPEDATIVADGDITTQRTMLFGAVQDTEGENSTTTVHTTFPELTGRTFKITFGETRNVTTIDWYGERPIALPIGVAEVGIPGFTIDPPDDQFDSGCRADLISIDGEPVPVRVHGSTADAVARRQLAVEPCGGEGLDGADLALTAGEHVLTTTPGLESGIDIDAVALTSAAGGDALDPAAWTDVPPRTAPTLAVTADGAVSATVTVDDLTEDAWLVLGQSHSEGWTASVEGGEDLGSPTLVDGFANGWRLDADDLGPGPVTIHLEWAPQRVIWWAIGLSVVGVVACLAVVAVSLVRGRRHRDRPRRPRPPDLVPSTDPIEAARAVRTGRAAVVAGAAGLLSLVVVPPPGWPAVVVAALVFVTLRARVHPRLLGWCAAACMAGVSAYYVLSQLKNRYPPDFAWPKEFDAAHAFGMVVVLLVLADAAIAAARTSRATRPRRQEPVRSTQESV
jgi:arabinofuranan 3-O-arabinosyltransferase